MSIGQFLGGFSKGPPSAVLQSKDLFFLRSFWANTGHSPCKVLVCCGPDRGHSNSIVGGQRDEGSVIGTAYFRLVKYMLPKPKQKAQSTVKSHPNHGEQIVLLTLKNEQD